MVVLTFFFSFLLHGFFFLNKQKKQNIWYMFTPHTALYNQPGRNQQVSMCQNFNFFFSISFPIFCSII
ncbi:hypothetical protein DAPPUDRAFT_304311 [Daphnia pulex]|uniref:Uncharacterized protein n=1 Tax=Daphnia pulex TaxID=6669 RepID=E9GL62_DAPPU|nr:hypothetical protein DAPPUDRAFT_304311 [Daphnia pulex]|eukprot:EFX79797.1 hypothetical protein DAPPUDRAFT_304311 [Daphnia pulex]